MKNVKISIMWLSVITLGLVITGFTRCTPSEAKAQEITDKELINPQMVNMFVTHGHCSTPFAGRVNNLKIGRTKRYDQGNELENMDISFSVDPNTFNVCSGEDLTKKIKTPGLFVSEENQMIKFRTTDVFTMGMDWYQVNGKLSIKGVEKSVKLFVTGIRQPNSNKAKSLVIEGQMDLTDWGIDYDEIVNGRSDSFPTKWMHLNMQVDI